MKKKKAPKKLTLKVETVRQLLEKGQLREAVGGSIGSCVETACPRNSCWC